MPRTLLWGSLGFEAAFQAGAAYLIRCNLLDIYFIKSVETYVDAGIHKHLYNR